MFTVVRTAVRFFFIGFAAGMLLAPRAGAETRALIERKVRGFAGSLLDVADAPTDEGGRRAAGSAARR